MRLGTRMACCCCCESDQDWHGGKGLGFEIPLKLLGFFLDGID
jgi:hypothetical protein